VNPNLTDFKLPNNVLLLLSQNVKNAAQYSEKSIALVRHIWLVVVKFVSLSVWFCAAFSLLLLLVERCRRGH
jgi:hypothetical protein